MKKQFLIIMFIFIFLGNAHAENYYDKLRNELENFKVVTTNLINNNTSSYFICGFPDVKYDNKFCLDIKSIAEKSWMVGMQTKTLPVLGEDKKKFMPYENITRGDFILAVMRVSGIAHDNQTCDDEGVNSAFLDVPKDMYWCYAIYRAYEKNIIQGTNGGEGNKFEPNRNINRAEALKIIIKASKYIANNMEEDNYIDKDIANSFINKILDLYEGNPWYQVYLDLAKENRIKGYQECYNCIDVDDFTDKLSVLITRGEVASLIRELTGALCYGRSITKDMHPDTIKNEMTIPTPNCNQIKSYYFYSIDGIGFIDGMISVYKKQLYENEIKKNTIKAFTSLLSLVILGFDGDINKHKLQLIFDTIVNNQVVMNILPGETADKIKLVSKVIEHIASYISINAESKNLKTMKDVFKWIRSGSLFYASLAISFTEYSTDIYSWFQEKSLDSYYHSIMVSCSFLQGYYKGGMPKIENLKDEVKKTAENQKYNDSYISYYWGNDYNIDIAVKVSYQIILLVNKRKEQYYVEGL